MTEITFRKIEANDLDRCEAILRALPEWFGIDAAIVDYMNTLQALDGYIAQTDEILGFIGLKRYGEASIEIDVMGVAPSMRRCGIGRRLLDHVETVAANENTRLFHMKTLAPSHPDPNYQQTRAFWQAMGYVPMDAHLLWGEDNPCQVMVKPYLPQDMESIYATS